MDDARGTAGDGREESEAERADRNLVELLQEARVVQTGVQILFGFLLTAAFQPKFEKLSSFQKGVYSGTLISAAVTLIMITAPTSWHRILFRHGDKHHLVTISNRFMLVGLSTMGLTSIGVVLLLSDLALTPPLTALVTALAVLTYAWAWYILPLARRRAVDDATRRPAPGHPQRRRRPDAA